MKNSTPSTDKKNSAKTNSGSGKNETKKEMRDHEVTQEDLDKNPELVTNGVKVGDIIQIEVVPDTAKKSTKNLDEQMKPYLKAYPNEKIFWVSSDGQVFLNANKSDAGYHQKRLDAKVELTEYVVK